MINKHLNVTFDKYSTQIPYIEINGKEEGPHIFISGGMHGDEINGIHLVKKFVEWCKDNNIEDSLKGRLTIIPIINVSGFEHMTRNVFEDDTDLNRSFSKDQPQSFTEKIAHELVKNIFSNCDFGIDCHDSGGRSVLLPHTRVHKCEPLNCETASKEMGQLFGTKIILEREGHENMLSIFMKDNYNTSVLTVEIGGAQTIFHNYIETGLIGIKNILGALQMINSKIKIPNKQFLLHDRYGITLKDAAEIKFLVDLGEFVKENQEICEVYYPQKQISEKIYSHSEGVIFSRWQFNQVPANRIIYSILEIDSNDNINKKTSDFDELKSIDVKKLIL